MSDWSLLCDYVERASEKAFETLVQRHVSMVYATALRRSRDPELSKDITQAVFVLLARKAGGLTSSTVLAGWLYRTTNFVTDRALRDAFRRQKREREAVTMSSESSNHELWEQVAPHLDAAISRLNDKDKVAVVLRFLEQRSFRDVADALGVTEDAAKKRVSRALEKLREHLRVRGSSVTVAALGAVLANTIQAAPASVMHGASRAALQAGAQASPAALALASEVASRWLLTRIMSAGITVVVCVVLLFSFNAMVSVKPAAETGSQVPVSFPSMETSANSTYVDAPEEQTDSNDVSSFRLVIVAVETGKPLTNAFVSSAFYGHGELNAKRTVNDQGVVAFRRPMERFQGMTFFVSAPGRIPLCVRWEGNEELLIPQEYVVKLSVGKVVTGSVLDEERQPVYGATLRFDSEGINDYSREYVDYRTTHAQSGDSGSWSADFLADRTDFSGRVSHPGYAETDFAFDLSTNKEPVILIRRGITVSGTVIDTDSRPIPAAELVVDWQFSWRKKLTTTSDATGKFEVPHVGENRRARSGNFRLRVSAKGFRPLEEFVEPQGADIDLQVVLEPLSTEATNKLWGRVVDQAGTPLRKVNVRLAESRAGSVEWSTTTDKTGVFSWDHAPNSPVRLVFHASLFEPLETDVAPGRDNVIVLQSQSTIELRVEATDAETGVPIPAFLVRRGELSDIAGLSAKPGSLKFMGEGSDGKFVSRFVPGEFGGTDRKNLTVPVLLVEAKGFVAAVLKFPNSLETTTNLSIALTPATLITGKVVLPSGQPAAGAHIGVTTEAGKMLPYMNAPGEFRKGDRNFLQQTTAHDDGSFSFVPQYDFDRMLVVHDAGWANVRRNESDQYSIHLRQWGRIEGVFKIGTQTIGGARIGASLESRHPENTDRISFSFGADPTDEGGRFTFEKVLPGWVSVSRWVHQNGFSAATVTELVHVREGETTTLQLGGRGVQVTGRFVAETDGETIAWNALPYYMASPGKLGQPRQFLCNPDGSFSIDDVLPGEYELQASAFVDLSPHDPPTFSASRYKRVGYLKSSFFVPPQSGTVDLGVITIPTK